MGMPQEKAKNVKGSLKRILSYIGKNKHLLYAMLAVMLVATLLNIIAPTIQAIAIDTITITEEQPVVDMNALIQWLIVLGSVYLLSAALTYFQNIFAAKLSQYTVRIMRKDLFARISRLPISYIDTHKHGDIMSRMTNDVENVSNSVSQSLGSLISGVIMVVGCFVMMLIHFVAAYSYQYDNHCSHADCIEKSLKADEKVFSHAAEKTRTAEWSD